MQFLTPLTLLFLTPLLLASPTPRSPISAYEVTNMGLFHGSGRPGNVNNYVVNIRMHDLDPAASDVYTNCTATWPMAEPNTWPHEYVDCADDDGNASFQWKFGRFSSLSDFLFEAKHTYEDPSVGYPNIVTTWAHANVTAGPNADLTCVGGASGVFSCGLRDRIPLRVDVYQAIA
ncbi:hypothetical protein P152DRAFT_451921 [Eremomyces bilateralis CBS 781.70]|uniref:AA1-like domain-containing protein n=1 Tax=Eremomyces bilateralis CBS 781.70 TaxID=1392243 RepID=A0A6G1FUP0_9PEZI|nr:uncharacterized protein P152DRAFT_451921 [Eremomyces bilateralis CBS 781.70]KAF1809473.1 hypothetical protein P152DRAFT_451921 [Eremomyces bilateralis CBS 781.70]